LILWQLEEHLSRLTASQHFMRFDNPISNDQARTAITQLLRANQIRHDVHIVATAFLSGQGQPFTNGQTSLAVTALERSDYSSDGLSAQVSSWRRPSDNALPQRVKANGNYLSARLAGVQAKTDGYDTAILLNHHGYVAEGTSMCFFMIRDGIVVTPDKQSGILESITRETLITLLSELGYSVEERKIERSELYYATEAFFCGTGWEIAPIRSIDGMDLKNYRSRSITRRLVQRFRTLTIGESSDHPEWRTDILI
jgi:branched-chain amino acid aminotransferase